MSQKPYKEGNFLKGVVVSNIRCYREIEWNKGEVSIAIGSWGKRVGAGD